MNMSSASLNAQKLLCELGAEEAQVGLILGSGLGGYGELLENVKVLNYADIPGFPTSQAPGHKNRFLLGERAGKKVLVMQGRFHYYEGWSIRDVTAGAETMLRLGIKRLLITNAAGCVNTAWHAGELMLIQDHINFSGTNPLIGKNDDTLGPRFPDMSAAYTPALREKAKAIAARLGIELHEGVYMMFTGPSFETPAEIRMARVLGADAAGMSTVPEVIAARHGGMEVLGITLLTNMAAGVLPQPLSAEEVLACAQKAAPQFTSLVDALLLEAL